MNNEETLKLLEEELAQAELMLGFSNKEVSKWRAIIDIREGNLNRFLDERERAAQRKKDLIKKGSK